MFVYADNAATTCVSKTALDAMMPYLTEQYGNPSSLYAFAQNAQEALENARKTVAAIIGAQPKEIYFTSGGCLTVPMWKELDDITNAYLDTVSLEDLLTGEKWRNKT